MASIFPTALVGEIARSVSETHLQKGGQLIFLNTSDIERGRILHRDYSSVEAMPGQAKKSVRAGDILFSEIRPANGRWVLIREKADDFIVSTKLMVIRPTSPRVDEGFLYRYLTSPETTSWLQLLADTRSGTFPQITWDQVAALEMPLPPLGEQRAIASLLTLLDDKLESNRRAMNLLENLGASLLEAELNLDVYGFPQYDTDGRLGDIVGVLETGSRPKGGALTSGEGTVSLGAESVQSAGVVNTQKFKTVPEDYAGSMRRGRLEEGDLLVYKDGGKPGNFIPHVSAFGNGFPVAKAVINEHVYRVRGVEGYSQGFLYWLLRSSWMDQEMRKRGTGVAIPGLNSTNFRNLPLPVIRTEAVIALNHALDPMLSGLLRFGAENVRLAELRDTLLPELLSGRTRVPEAQEAIG